jgi:hypothetical protein
MLEEKPERQKLDDKALYFRLSTGTPPPTSD